jgi:flagellar biosynthesis protein FlhB
MCVVIGSTAYIIGMLVSGKTKQFMNVVKRELGPRWSDVQAIIGSVLTTLVACIIFLLASDIAY